MEDIEKLNISDGGYFSSDHEWLVQDGNIYLVGITDYAQGQLGEIVFVELPEIGASFQRGDEFGTIESVKAVSTLLMPISGKVTAVNDELVDDPEKINQDAQNNWIVKIDASDPEEISELMNKARYLEMIRNI